MKKLKRGLFLGGLIVSFSFQSLASVECKKNNKSNFSQSFFSRYKNKIAHTVTAGLVGIGAGYLYYKNVVNNTKISSAYYAALAHNYDETLNFYNDDGALDIDRVERHRQKNGLKNASVVSLVTAASFYIVLNKAAPYVKELFLKNNIR